MRRPTTQPPLFPGPCIVCRFERTGEHHPWCPQFMRGAAAGGDPSEWPSLLDELDPTPGEKVTQR